MRRKGEVNKMAAKIVVEAIVYSLVYSVFMLGLFKVQGARK